MLSDSDGERELREYEDPPGTSSDSWVAPRRLNSPPALAVAPGPRIDQFNAHKNSKVYIGDRFIKVSKTVHHTEVVKAQFGGFELEAGVGRAKNRTGKIHNRRLRCSVAVFVCWALLVATGLALYLMWRFVLVKWPARLDLGHVLGLELEATVGKNGDENTKSGHLRRSVIVFVSWALVVATGLAFYLLWHYVLAVQPTRLDLEVGPVRYLWEWARRTSFAERIAFCVSLAALALCGVLVCTLTGQEPITEPDIEKEWNITRTTWLAVPREVEIFPYDPSVLPLRLVVVQHTAGAECFKFADCSGLMRLLQQYFLEKYDYDIPYNFVVANDGRVYEGRGYVGGVAAHTLNYNRCSMGLGFTGDYRRIGGGSHVTELQLNRTLQLLEGGVRDGIIHPRYVVVAASDLKPTASPGDDIYEAMSQWPNFNVDKNRFRNRTCEDIYDELRALDKKEPDSVRRTGSR